MTQTAHSRSTETAPVTMQIGDLEPQDVSEFRLIFLDRLSVVEGVCRRERLRSAEDLVVGDEFRVPEPECMARFGMARESASARVRILSPVHVGQNEFTAWQTHRLCLMSELGQVVEAHLLLNGSGRSLLTFTELVDPGLRYTLIDLATLTTLTTG